MFVRTEEGRVIDFSRDALLELVDGKWSRPSRPVSTSEIWNGTRLSEEEVSHLLKSGS